MYRARARIAYTCPVYLAEIVPYDLYKIVPEGVTLVTATASVWQGAPEESRQRQALRTCGIADRITGYGRLLREM
jgi:hypothetical protein